MVHDLTANRDFQEERNFNLLPGMTLDNDKLTPPHKEIVLTGTALDRQTKRYCLDYASNESNMCDCCGSPIRIKPWDFEDNKPLCPDCEKWLEETHNSREDGRLLEEIVDDSFTIMVAKPWDISNFERENAVDNVLLWD